MMSSSLGSGIAGLAGALAAHELGLQPVVLEKAAALGGGTVHSYGLIWVIFRRYAELGSVRLLKAELDAQGRKSKSWTSAGGRVIGGKLFSRGALYLMLRNRIYRGEIVHAGSSRSCRRCPGKE